MTRKLGIALLAALAIGAFAAQGASAHQFTSGVDATDITGVNVGNHVLEVKPAGAKVTCTGALFTGTQVGEEADTVDVTPTYSGCTVGALPATVDTTGCHYVLGSDTTAAHGVTSAGVDLDCNDAGAIKVTVFSGANHAVAPICTISFGDTHPAGTSVNQNLHGVTYSHAGSGTTTDVTVTSHVKTIVFTATGPQCAAAGVPATGKEGAYNGDVTVKGYLHNSDHDDPDNHVAIEVD